MEIVYLIILLMCIVYFIVHPLIDYIPWFQWWYATNKIGNSGGYSCVDLVALALFKNNWLSYQIYNAMSGGNSRFTNDGQVFFIESLMASMSTAVGGKMVPKDLCDTLVPVQTFGIPWPTTKGQWQNLLCTWAGIDPNTVFKNLDDYKPNLQKWTTTPENFLFINWGIGPLSPLIAGFITNFTGSGFNDTKLYGDLLSPLLGLQTGLGGWMGFLQNSDTTLTDKVSIYSQVWSHLAEAPQSFQNAVNKNSECSAGKLIGPVGNGVIAGVMTGAMLASAAGGPIGIVVGLITAAIMGGGAIASACG